MISNSFIIFVSFTIIFLVKLASGCCCDCCCCNNTQQMMNVSGTMIPMNTGGGCGCDCCCGGGGSDTTALLLALLGKKRRKRQFTFPLPEIEQNNNITETTNSSEQQMFCQNGKCSVRNNITLTIKEKRMIQNQKSPSSFFNIFSQNKIKNNQQNQQQKTNNIQPYFGENAYSNRAQTPFLQRKNSYSSINSFE